MPAKLHINSVVSSGNMHMPIVGLGTWQNSDEQLEEALTVAIEAGYRHIDTAQMYMNETVIGQTLKKLFDDGTVTREEMFIATKLPPYGMRPEKVEKYINLSLENLQLDYLDLYLMHYPIAFKEKPGEVFPRDENGDLDLDMDTDHLEIWKAMEAQVDAGRTKAVGLSNFNTSQIKRIIESCRIPPACNQVEMHIYLQQKSLVKFCKENDITVCAYAPLGSPHLFTFTEFFGVPTEGMRKLSPLTDPVIKEIAKSHGKAPSQILLRFLIEYGIAVIPKSMNPERIKQNIDIFDFELTQEEFQQIQDLDKGEDGRMFESTGLLASLDKHPEYPHSK